jgi:hypothetical protein
MEAAAIIKVRWMFAGYAGFSKQDQQFLTRAFTFNVFYTFVSECRILPASSERFIHT